MSDFNQSIVTVLKHEGGWVNNPNDNGGATNYGISLRWLAAQGHIDVDHDGYLDGDINHDGVIDAKDIREMTVAEAMLFYREFWWDTFHYDKITAQRIATKVFDMAVNMGAKQAHKLTQRACNNFNWKLVVDGVLGGVTFNAINNSIVTDLGPAICTAQADFYRGLVNVNPKFEEFKHGWLTRAAQW